MSRDRRVASRRQYLASALAAASVAGAGCQGSLPGDLLGDDAPDDAATDDAGPGSGDDAGEGAGGDGEPGRDREERWSAEGPLEIVAVERLETDGLASPLRAANRTTPTAPDGTGEDVVVAVDVANAGRATGKADLVVELSHTGAAGTLERERTVYVAAGLERTVHAVFRPQLLGDLESVEGEFRAGARLTGGNRLEDYPGPIEVGGESSTGSGATWPSPRGDAGATGHSPGVAAPRSEPTRAWSAEDVGVVSPPTGPVVGERRVYAGEHVRALDVDTGRRRWLHDDARRVGGLAVSDGLVVFGTETDLRAVDAAAGDLEWRVTSPGGPWAGGVTVADGRVYSWAPREKVRPSGATGVAGRLHVVDASSGEVLWTHRTNGSLRGQPPVGAGLVLADADPFQGLDLAEERDRWLTGGFDPVTAAALANDTAYRVEGGELRAAGLTYGRRRWREPGPFSPGQFAVGQGSVVARTAGSSRLAALDARTGSPQWVTGAFEGRLGPPTVTPGAVLVADGRSGLHAIDPDTGDPLWSHELSGAARASVAVAAPEGGTDGSSSGGTDGARAGTCYVLDGEGTLHALSPP